MLKRTLLAILLMMSLTTAGAARAPFPQDEKPDGAAGETLTPAERDEALALAEDFIARFEKTEDVAPLVKDFYVSDFITRLRGNPKEMFPLATTPQVAAQMSDEELMRAYAASINGFHLLSRLFIVADRKRVQERAERGAAEDEDESEPTLEEIFPPSLLKLIKSDALLGTVLTELSKEESRNRAAAQPVSDGEAAPEAEGENSPQLAAFEDIFPFQTIEQMRHYTRFVEQAMPLIRDYLQSLPPESRPSVSSYMAQKANSSEDDEAETPPDLIKPRLYVLRENFMDYPAGTHLICANVLVFHMDMVRAADGHLKVLHVYLMMD